MTLVQRVHLENERRTRDADRASAQATAGLIRSYAQQLIDSGYRGHIHIGWTPYLDALYEIDGGRAYRRPTVGKEFFGLLHRLGKEEIELKDVPYEEYPFIGYLEWMAGELEKRLNKIR